MRLSGHHQRLVGGMCGIVESVTYRIQTVLLGFEPYPLRQLELLFFSTTLTGSVGTLGASRLFFALGICL